jgi:hypothetical protein
MSPAVVSFIDRRRPRIVQASVTCDHCPWGATQTGPNAIDVSLALRVLILQHFRDRHPELVPKDGHDA